MNLIERVRAVEGRLGELWKLVMDTRKGGGGGGGGTTPHNLLSTTHPDSAAGSPTRGDIIVGNSTPKWARLAKSAAGLLLGYDATDIVAINPNTLDVDQVDSKHAADFLGVAAQAVDSDKLDGNHAAAFLGAGAQAVDSDKVDGKHATEIISPLGKTLTISTSNPAGGTDGDIWFKYS